HRLHHLPRPRHRAARPDHGLQRPPAESAERHRADPGAHGLTDPSPPPYDDTKRGVAMASERSVTIGLVQMRCDCARATNLERAPASVGGAGQRGANAVVLPELFPGPYFCQRPDDQSAFAPAEPIPGPTTEALGEAARRHRITLVGGSVFERGGDGRFYNT